MRRGQGGQGAWPLASVRAQRRVPTPRILRRRRHDPGSHRVEVHVGHAAQGTRVPPDQGAPEPPLPQAPDAPPRAVGHQAVVEQRERGTPPGLLEKPDEKLERGRLGETLAVVAPQGDVVDRMRARESRRPWHPLTSVRSIPPPTEMQGPTPTYEHATAYVAPRCQAPCLSSIYSRAS